MVKRKSKIYTGHVIINQENPFEEIIKRLSTNLSLSPILRKKEEDFSELFHEFDIREDKKFFGSFSRELLTDSDKQVLLCLNIIMIAPEYSLLSINIAYKDSALIDKILESIKSIKGTKRIMEGSFEESRKIKSYDEQLSNLSPHGSY